MCLHKVYWLSFLDTESYTPMFGDRYRAPPVYRKSILLREYTDVVTLKYTANSLGDFGKMQSNSLDEFG